MQLVWYSSVVNSLHHTFHLSTYKRLLQHVSAVTYKYLHGVLILSYHISCVPYDIHDINRIHMYISTHEGIYAFLYITLYIKGPYYSVVLLYTVSSDSPKESERAKNKRPKLGSCRSGTNFIPWATYTVLLSLYWNHVNSSTVKVVCS